MTRIGDAAAPYKLMRLAVMSPGPFVAVAGNVTHFVKLFNWLDCPTWFSVKFASSTMAGGIVLAWAQVIRSNNDSEGSWIGSHRGVAKCNGDVIYGLNIVRAFDNGIEALSRLDGGWNGYSINAGLGHGEEGDGGGGGDDGGTHAE